ncbi:hypothetical protein MFUL124B02_06120 [Myxococcus fulvus 124B02]|nr:hypothetical protein MFUL124B02_06120 [Myxococcus fulvus 124B02]
MSDAGKASAAGAWTLLRLSGQDHVARMGRVKARRGGTMYSKDVFSTVALSGGVLLGLVGLLGGRLLSGAAVLGRWPVGRREWGQCMLLLGGVKPRHIKLLSFVWFFVCAFLAFAFIIAVMLYGKRTYGWP